MSGVDTVEAEVRELVRRRGLDPVEDRLAVRRLVDEVVAEYDERALTSTLQPLSDASSAARSVYDAVAGYGPLQRHRDDPEVEEVWVYEQATCRSCGAPVQTSQVGDRTRTPARWSRWGSSGWPRPETGSRPRS